MLQDIESMTDSEIYQARFEIAGAINRAKGLAIHLSKDAETRDQSIELRRLHEKAESRLLQVIRPR